MMKKVDVISNTADCRYKKMEIKYAGFIDGCCHPDAPTGLECLSYSDEFPKECPLMDMDVFVTDSFLEWEEEMYREMGERQLEEGGRKKNNE